MSNSNGQVSFVKSMNGILSFNTGSGTIIEGDTITTDTLICDTIACPQLNADALQAFTPGASCNLYTQTTGGASSIRIGNSGIVLNVDSGIASTSPIYCSELHATNVYASTSLNTTFLDTPFTSDTPYLWPLTTGQITIGSATTPIIGARVCTADNQLANKQYVDSALSGTSLLPLTNIWTGASNTFNNFLDTNTIRSIAVGATVNLFNNLTTGTLTIGKLASQINIGTGLTTGSSTINIGTSGFSTISLNGANTIIATLVSSTVNLFNNLTTGILNMATGMTTGSINIGGTNTITSIYRLDNVSTITAPDITSAATIHNNITTGSIALGGGLTTGVINLGSTNVNADIVSNCPHQFNKGITFQNSNVQQDKIITGNITTTNAVAGQNITLQTHIYTNSYTFGSGTLPYVICQIQSATASGNLIISTRDITTTGFTTYIRCNTNTGFAANAYSIQYIAIGNA